MPPAITAGPPVKIAARHIPASARSHDPRRRRLVILGNLSSSIFQPPGTSFINPEAMAVCDDTQSEP
jgi:hypothetical protein